MSNGDDNDNNKSYYILLLLLVGVIIGAIVGKLACMLSGFNTESFRGRRSWRGRPWVRRRFGWGWGWRRPWWWRNKPYCRYVYNPYGPNYQVCY